MKLAEGADLHQWNEGEQQNTCKEDREYQFSHGFSSFHSAGNWL